MWRKYHGIVPFGVATGSQEGGASPSPTLNGAAQDRLLDQVTRLNKKLAARLAFVIIIHKQPNYTGIRPLLFVTTLEITEASILFAKSPFSFQEGRLHQIAYFPRDVHTYRTGLI